MPKAPNIEFETTSTPNSTDLNQVGTALAAFNDSDVGSSEKTTLAIFARDENGDLQAGLAGHTAWGWLYIQWLWIHEDHRGRGFAGQLLHAAETEAAKRQCHSAHIDTFSPIARKTYEKNGYKVFGELENFPKGRTRTFLQKQLFHGQ